MKREILYFSEFVALNEARSAKPKQPKVKVIILFLQLKRNVKREN